MTSEGGRDSRRLFCEMMMGIALVVVDGDDSSVAEFIDDGRMGKGYGARTLTCSEYGFCRKLSRSAQRSALLPLLCYNCHRSN